MSLRQLMSIGLSFIHCGSMFFSCSDDSMWIPVKRSNPVKPNKSQYPLPTTNVLVVAVG